MEEKNIRQTLLLYLLGKADEKKINAVDDWYRSFDTEAPVILSDEEASITAAEIWDRVEPVTKIKKRIWLLSRPMKAAAVIIVIAGAGALFLLYKSGSKTPVFTTISTGTGEKKKITAPDGSQLVLDAATTIRIQNDFALNRRVELVDGEVFFDVKKDDDHPFIVESGELTTTVLGTSFNISAYKDLNNISIGVVSGKVSVAGKDLTVGLLEKEQEIVYNKKSRSHRTITLDESLTAWRDGRLVLNDLSFDEMTVIMKKNFGVGIFANNEVIRNTRYTTELLASMSPLEAAEVLAAIHHLRIRQKDDKIFLYK